ncbi:MAG: hypothetical protein HGB03_02245 [Candidatus Yonathbacteria bacterium]|nr:hypothetical protein [Candidatus Yonathbacteria bacterium]NTW47539.1 hypothetical protein [Candidatus Yonathbacteria bacterium]
MNTNDLRAILKENDWRLVEVHEDFRPAENSVIILAEKTDPIAKQGKFDAFIKIEVDFLNANYDYSGNGSYHFFSHISRITLRKVTPTYRNKPPVFQENDILEWIWRKVYVGKTIEDGEILDTMRQIEKRLKQQEPIPD